MGSSVGGQAGRNAEKVTRESLQSWSISVGDSPMLPSSFWPAPCSEPGPEQAQASSRQRGPALLPTPQRAGIQDLCSRLGHPRPPAPEGTA